MFRAAFSTVCNSVEYEHKSLWSWISKNPHACNNEVFRNFDLSDQNFPNDSVAEEKNKTSL